MSSLCKCVYKQQQVEVKLLGSKGSSFWKGLGAKRYPPAC